MKLIVTDKGTGKELDEIFFLYDDELWQCEFGSCDSIVNTERMWCGEANKLSKDSYIIRFED